MSFLSDVKNAGRKAFDQAERAAEAVTEKAKEAVAAGTEKVKEAAGRAKPAEPPPPSKAVDDHTAQAAAAAARNAPANVNGAKKSQAANPNLAVYGGVGVGTGVGTGPFSTIPTAVVGPQAAGGEISAGGIIGLGDGEMKSYGSTGTAKEADGIAAGAGVEVGIILDSNAFFGDGHHYQASVGPLTGNVQTTPEGKVNALSIGVGKSSGGGWFHYETKTEDTTGR